MHSTPKPVQADAPAIAPEIVPAAWADKVLADITSGTKSHAPDQRPAPQSGGAPALAIDTTFRAAAVGNVQAPREKPPAGKPAGSKWVTKAIMGFMFALCSAMAAAAWQHYGDAAKQMVSNWIPQFTLAASPPLPTDPTGQPDASAVQASAADRAPPSATSAQPPEGAASDAAPLSPESSPSIQSMTRDLAAMGQQIEQLKGDIADLKTAQQSMARDVSKTSEKSSEKTSEARAEAKTSAVRTSVPHARTKMSAPPLRSAAVQALRPMSPYPPVAAPPQPAPPPQLESAPADEPVIRPPLPLH
jgi:hypothetical protein